MPDPRTTARCSRSRRSTRRSARPCGTCARPRWRRTPPTVDEEARYPEEAAAALQAADFHAPHVPEEYGGAGADALATVLVIEEIARVCVASSLIPAVNKLGSLPVILAGLRGDEEEVPDPAGVRRRRVLLLPVRARRGLRRGGDEDARGPRRRRLGARRREALDHQRRRLGVLHGDGRDRPGARTPRASRRSWSRGPTRACPSAPRRRSSASRAARPARSTSTRSGSPRDRMIGEEGTGFETAMRTLDHTRITIAAQAVGVAQGALDYALATPRSASSSASRSPTSRACSSCWPTWA